VDNCLARRVPHRVHEVARIKSEKYRLTGRLTIEHVLPQHWEEHWPRDREEGESEVDYADRRRQRGHLLHTIGNLTLLSVALNPHVSNGEFAKKRQAIVKHSAINPNRDLAEENDWNESRILARGEHLFGYAKRVWPFPGSAEDGRARLRVDVDGDDEDE
jgi:hypothetical protein